jgi:hypothetical protein
VVFPRPEGADRSGIGGFSAPRGRRSVRHWWFFRAQRAQIRQALVVFPRPEGADPSGFGGFSAPRGRRSVRRWWFFRAQRAQIRQALVVFPRPEGADPSGAGILFWVSCSALKIKKTVEF